MEDENASRYKDRSKNSRRGVQTIPELERVFGTIGPIQHFQSANSLRVTIRHTIFDLFANECVWIQTLIVRAYFLVSSGLYKQRLNLIIQHIFSTLWEAYVLGSQIAYIFLSPFLVLLLKLGFLGFKENCINFFEPLNILSRTKSAHARGCFLTLFLMM